MKQPLLSVILCVYNTVDYLERLFGCIEAQTFTGFEVVVIDTRSDDGSYEFCMSKALVDKRIRVFRTEGRCFPDPARQYGFGLTEGKYVLSIDSDDEFSSNYFMDLVSTAEKHDLDFAVGSCQRIDEHSKKVSKPEFLSKTSIELMTERDKKILCKGRYGGWNRLARKQFLLDKGYDYSQAELPLFICQFYEDVRVGYCRDALYFYRERGNSISRKKVPERIANYDCLEPLGWVKAGIINKSVHGLFSVYVYRMILPYLLYKKAFLKNYDYKADIRFVGRSLNYNFFVGLAHFAELSKRDRTIFLTFLFHVYWPAFYFIKKYRM